MDYSCGRCGRTIVKTAGPIQVKATARCPRCREIVELRALDAEEILHATYRCTGCEREQRVERPVEDRRYCIVCGTESLERISTTPRSRQEEAKQARAPVEAGHPR